MGLCCARGADTTKAYRRQSRLEGRHLAELGRVITELLIQGIGVYRPLVLHPSDHAAIIFVPEAIKLLGVGHRQRLEHHGVNQGEDRSVGPDAECERDHTYERKSGRLTQPAPRISEVL